ncbi:MAG: ABC transporter ATP-binding protein [Ktedonobacterales bacterium]
MDITLSDLTKVYRGNVHALNGLNLTIPSGMFGLVGPNGAGKTTLMRILAGILHPTSGTVRIGDREIHSEGDRTYVKRMLGYLPQELGVYPDLSAREFLDYIAILKGLDDHQTRRRRVAEVIDVVSLADVASRKLKTFSGGMKRRVGIAQALLNDPQLLIVDEPTAGLDPEERIRFRNLLADLGGNRTVLLSTHIVEDIAQTSQNLAAITGGRVIFQGTIAGLIDAARGHVWNITLASGVRPEGDVTVVSTLTQGTSVQYRVVGEPASALRALPVEPSLEDGYVWLMRERRAPSLALS